MNTTNNIAFLTIATLGKIDAPGIYNDLIESLSIDNRVCVLSPVERKAETNQIQISKNLKIVEQRILKYQKTNKIEKIISLFTTEFAMAYSLLKIYRKEKFDLLVISTPPIFLLNFIRLFKLLNPHAKIYLLLKDIFPQNAIDIGIMNKGGIFHWYCQKMEKKLYANSDKIGVMSEGNLNFVLENNSIPAEKVEINPNSINIKKLEDLKPITSKESKLIDNRTLNLIYGGNLGKPQDPNLICSFIKRIESLENIKFFIVGSGTEKSKIENYVIKNKFEKTFLISQVSKQEYLDILSKCHIGLIFLDQRFTIPNFPSRLIDYLFADLTILSITDAVTDLNKFIVENRVGYAFTQKTDQVEQCIQQIKKIQKSNSLYHYKGSELIRKYFDVRKSASLIINLLK